MEPSWHKIALKVDPKNDQKNDHHFDGIQIDFWSILAPTWGVRGGPTNQVFATFWALGAILEPRWPQDPPRPPQGAILIDF